MLRGKVTIQERINASSDKEEKELLKLFPEILELLREQLQTKDDDFQDCQAHVRKMVDYVVPQLKNVPALTVVKLYRDMVKAPSPEEIKLIRILAWCYQMHISSFRICDELMFDKTVDEEGSPCFHKLIGKNIEIFNEALFIECLVYLVLHNYIEDGEKLMSVEEMIRNSIKQNVIGQYFLQETLKAQGKADFSLFTMERYNMYVKYSISHYRFYLPLKLVLFWVGINDTSSLNSLENVAQKLGRFLQAKDDYLNCYGNQEVFGKAGSNIGMNKICWLIVTAMEKATDEQKETLKANYGQPKQECINKVKAIYDNLDINGAFRKYEKAAHQELLKDISNLSDDLPKTFLSDSANSILNWEDKLYY